MNGPVPVDRGYWQDFEIPIMSRSRPLYRVFSIHEKWLAAAMGTTKKKRDHHGSPGKGTVPCREGIRNLARSYPIPRTVNACSQHGMGWLHNRQIGCFGI